MERGDQGGGHDPEAFRGFLIYLASLHLDPRLQSKLDADDLVQETLLEAHQKIAQFRGQSAAQLKAWLRQILFSKIANALQKFRTQKCNVNLEQPLEAAIDRSSAHFQDLLAADQSTPSEKAQRNEELLGLEAALADLPERQRQVVTLKYFQKWTLAEIAKHLDITHAAVVGLLNRGLMKLTNVLAESD